MGAHLEVHTLKYVLSTIAAAAAAVVGRGEVHCGMPRNSK